MSAVKSAGDLMEQLGVLQFLVLFLVVAFSFFIYQIVKIQAQTANTLKHVGDKVDVVGNTLSVHDQRAADMHHTCNTHGSQLDNMYEGMQEFRTKLLERIAKLEQEVAVLKEKVVK